MKRKMYGANLKWLNFTGRRIQTNAEIYFSKGDTLNYVLNENLLTLPGDLRSPLTTRGTRGLQTRSEPWLQTRSDQHFAAFRSSTNYMRR